MYNWKHKLTAAVCMAVMLLTACGGVTKEQLAARESAITMMSQGDYEEAVAEFNRLVENAKSVTEFELDILKYRAEAEFMLEDYAAAVHTYRTLMEVEKERPEYCYFTALALARNGQTAEAETMLEKGMELDKKRKPWDIMKRSLRWQRDMRLAMMLMRQEGFIRN